MSYWGLIGYIICLGLTLLFTSPFHSEMFNSFYHGSENWVPNLKIVHAFPMPLVVFFLIAPGFVLLFNLLTFFFRKKKKAIHLIYRFLIVCIIGLVFIGSISTVNRGRAIIDKRSLEFVESLNSGLDIRKVVKLINSSGFFKVSVIGTEISNPITFGRSYYFGFGSDRVITFQLTLHFNEQGNLSTFTYSRKEEDYDLNKFTCQILAPKKGKCLLGP